MKFCLRSLLVVLIAVVASGVAAAQTRRKPIQVKKPVITATVTVKGEPYAPPVFPAETDEGIWNDVQIGDGRINLTFPSTPETLEKSADVLESGGQLASVSAYTKHGSYKAYTRPVAPLTSNRDIDDVLERSIADAFSGPNAKVLQMTTVHYDGVRGKEFVAAVKKSGTTRVQYIRAFILGNLMVSLMVEIDDRANEEKMKPWIQKFFDSLSVPLSNKQVT